MPSWNHLPVELRWMILNLLTDDETVPKPPLASVCREWQYVIEKRTFRELVISQQHLQDFDRMMKRKPCYRLAYVKKLRYRILLDKYDCKSCQTAEDEATIQRNCAVFTKAVCDLLKSLAQNTRPMPNRDQQASVLLDISVHSPSDHEHSFRPWCLQDDYPYKHSDPHWEPVCKSFPTIPDAKTPDPELFEDRRRQELQFHDVRHGWNHGIFTLPQDPGTTGSLPTMQPSARDRAFGTRPLDFDFSLMRSLKKGQKRRLPRATVVHWLMVRRSNFRGISPNVIFRLMHESFPWLWSLRIEKWREVHMAQQTLYQQEFAKLLEKKGFPQVLYDFNWVEDHHSELTVPAGPREETLGLSLARASRGLTWLTATWQVDAESFLAEYYTNSWARLRPDSFAMVPWQNLRVVSLTSTSLAVCNTHEGRCKARQMLEAAHRAATLMPLLQAMQIWDCSDGPWKTAKIAHFVYESGFSDDPPFILWSTSFPATSTLKIDDEVFKRWGDLARERDPAGREARMHQYDDHHVSQRIRRSGVVRVSHWGYMWRLSTAVPAILDMTSYHEIHEGEEMNWPALGDREAAWA